MNIDDRNKTCPRCQVVPSGGVCDLIHWLLNRRCGR
jgi:hypothetical protein